MKHRSALLIFVLALGTFGAQAKGSSQAKPGSSNLRASYAKCIDAADSVTPSMQGCMMVEYAHQDKRLNAAYKNLMALLDKDDRVKLRADERIWIAYRKSHCAPVPDAGQADALSSFDCSIIETAKQAAALENRLFMEQLKH